MHISIWTRFTDSSMQAAMHMYPSYENNLEIFKNSEFENIKGLFSITRMIIEENSEIKNVFSADIASSLWEKSGLLHDQAMKWRKARVHVYSDSVLCLGKCTVQKMQSKSGMIKCRVRRCVTPSENCKDWMESRLTSSGRFPRSQRIGPSPRDSGRSAKKARHT